MFEVPSRYKDRFGNSDISFVVETHLYHGMSSRVEPWAPFSGKALVGRNSRQLCIVPIHPLQRPVSYTPGAHNLSPDECNVWIAGARVARRLVRSA